MLLVVLQPKLSGKESTYQAGDVGSIPVGQEDDLEREMATHSSILAWEIPCREKPGRLQSMGLQRAGHDSVTEHTAHRRQPTWL